MKWIEDEFAESRELAVASPANEIKIPNGYVASSSAIVNELRKMYGAGLL